MSNYPDFFGENMPNVFTLDEKFNLEDFNIPEMEGKQTFKYLFVIYICGYFD